MTAASDNDQQQLIKELNAALHDKSPTEILAAASQQFGDTLCFASSLGLEDQLITHLIATNNIPIRIFTLDTGRLFQESYALLEQTQERYGINIQVYYPERDRTEKMVNEHGINLFRKSVELRKECCSVRKIEPLKRALSTSSAWIVGLRQAQSVTRAELSAVEWDAGNRLVKFNPLWSLSDHDLRKTVDDEMIPYNVLHNQGFLSIGCNCCTRAVQPGEDIRAGRWWWENPETKECGLHQYKDGAGI